MPSNESRHTGKVVLVTGAGSGIGAATALTFAGDGASVVVADIDAAAADEVVATITAAGGTAAAVTANAASSDDIAAAVALAVDRFGGLDIAVANAAGGVAHGPVDAVDEAAWDEMFAVNVRGAFLVVKHAVPELRRRGGGSLLFTASLGAKQGTAGMATYGATKAAIVNLVKTMALDYAADGIRVNAVCPGAIATPGLTRGRAPLDAIAAMIPMRRLGDAAEVASVYSFLASDEASYVTGQAIDVDGGWGAGLAPMGPPPGGPPPQRG
jgi:meso-butanediol dehydrogenase / (S,S)-butanediol dehydrogenase / diacetyl reductase